MWTVKTHQTGWIPVFAGRKDPLLVLSISGARLVRAFVSMSRLAFEVCWFDSRLWHVLSPVVSY